MTDKSKGLRKHDVQALRLQDIARILLGAGTIQTRWMSEPMIVLPAGLIPSLLRRLLGPYEYHKLTHPDEKLP